MKNRLCKKQVLICMLLAFAALLYICPRVMAEEYTVQASGEYQAGETESPSAARERALDQAVRNAAEQAGVYVESFSRTNNLTLTADEVKIISSAMVKIVDKKYTVTLVDSKSGACLYRADIVARISSDDIAALKEKVHDKEAKKEFADIERRFSEQQEEINRLKKQLDNAHTDAEKKRAEAEIQLNESKFMANKYYEAADQLYFSENYKDALDLYTKALKTFASPDYYIARGYCYAALDNKDAELADFDKAVETNPAYYRAYGVRAEALVSREQYDAALSDYNRAVAFAPDLPDVYIRRGNFYWTYLENQEHAVDDYSQAIALDDGKNDADMAYYWRGQIYYGQEKFEQAVADFEAFRLKNLNFVDVYIWQARANDLLGNTAAARELYQKMLALDIINDDASNKDLIQEAQTYIEANSDAR